MTVNYSVRNTLSPSSKKFLDEQLALFTKDNLKAKMALNLVDKKIGEAVKRSEGERVIAVDLGASKARSFLIQIQNGTPKALPESEEFTKTLKGRDGKGYVEFLQEISKLSKEHNLKVGIATAGVVEGSRLLKSPNLTGFVEEINKKFEGDIARIFENNVSVVNDAVAGTLASVLEVELSDPDENVIYFINGGGIGGAVITNGEVWATEPGHVPVIDALNVFETQRQCTMWEGGYVCVENVAASGAGLENIWHEVTGEAIRGEDIKDKYNEKSSLARNLYHVSAFISAHTIYGMGKAFGLWQQPMMDMVIMHGGIFNVPGYAESVAGYVRGNLGSDIKYESTVVMKKNLSLLGAGLLPLLSA